MSSNYKHETKQCPRCAVDFECKSGSILLCQCQTIYLTSEQVDYVGAQYNDCLCVTCLQELCEEFEQYQHLNNLHKPSL